MTNKIIKITADSTCDLIPELQKKYDITLVPLHVSLGKNSYLDGVDIEGKDLFAYFDRTKELPKTSAPSLQDYINIFDQYPEDKYEVIHLALSSGISSSYNNACFVAKDRPNIHVIDTKNISGTSALIAINAARMIESGKTLEEIIPAIETMVRKGNTSFIIETLLYLYKGGRCGATAVLANSVLDIKPCIEMHDGIMIVGKKYRKMTPKIVRQYLCDMLSGRSLEDNDTVYLVDTFYDDTIPNLAYDILKNEFQFKEIFVNKAGSIISTHCGPNTIGLFFLNK